MKRIFAGIICAGLLMGGVQAKIVGHWPLKPKSPLYIEWDADDGDSNTWRTSYGATSGSANVPIVTLPNGDKVWEQVSSKSLFSSALIPIDPSKSYQLSGTLRSTGSIDSKVYFGFLPIIDNGLNGTQTHAQGFRKGDDGVMQSWNDTTITLSSSPTGWNPDANSYSSRLMGFYYDGNTTKAPDFVMYSSSYGTTHRGAYISVSGSTINLSAALPSNVTDNLIPGVSVVKNHYGGCGSYLYSVLSGSYPSQTWSTYSDISTGDGYTQTQCEAFRPFTRYVRIMFLMNYQQDSTATLQFDKIILEEVQGNEPERYELNPNDATDAAKLSFSVVDDGSGSDVWEKTGYQSRNTNELIPIDTSKTYRASGEFRTIGATPATLYYGVQSVSAQKNVISNNSLNMYGDDATISSYNDTTITTDATLGSWWIPDEPNKSRAALAFYYNGATDRLPDYVWSASPNGVYSNASGTTVTLREALPANITQHIQLNTSKVKSIKISGNSTTLLIINPSSALPGSTMKPEVPTSWTSIGANITGEVWGTTSSAFHKFAEFAKLTVLANESASGATLQIRNLKLETVNDGSHKIYDETPLSGIAIDSRHHGSNYGAIYAEGPNGSLKGSMNFDGENDYISMSNASIFHKKTGSISFWIKPEEKNNTNTSMGQVMGNFSSGGWQVLYSYATNTLSFDYRIDTPSIHSNPTLGTLPLDQWKHITISYNLESAPFEIKYYVDGILTNTVTPTDGLIDFAGSEVFQLGKVGTGYYNGYFKGSLSSLRMYDNRLTTTEISALSGKKENFTSAAEITTKSTNKTATHNLLYWDIASKEYWIGQFDGSLQQITAPTGSFKTTSELTTVQSGKTATNGQLYWDTDKKKYYVGQPNGELRPLDE